MKRSHKGYNERLFNRNTVRGRFHFARYYWLKDKVNTWSPNIDSVLELGCFDAKTLDFIPSEIQYYEGFDANWEGGLDLAIEKYQSNKQYKFELCTEVENFVPSQEFDISISMETLEHLPLKDLDKYLEQLRNATKTYCYVTIPNEKGLMLVLKYLIKKHILRRTPDKYTTKELWKGFRNKLDEVERIEGSHKGFDYEKFIDKLKNYFEIIEINGIPFNRAPKFMYFSIGIVLRKLK